MRREDFESLYEEHAQDLFAFLAYRTGDRALAEDLAADAFERAYRSRKRFDERRAGRKTWLYAIALNALRDHHRRTRTRERTAERHAAGREDTDDLARATARVDAMAAMDALTPEERETVALRYGGDFTVPEIAKVTGQSLTTAEGRLYRALRKLRAEMGEPAESP